MFLTAYQNLFNVAHLAQGETVLVHAGASGVGTAAVQLIREAGAESLVTAGSPEKIARCLALGARAGWNHKEGPFVPWVAEQPSGKGVDVVLDFVGAPYFDQNLKSLAPDGRMVVIGTLGGAEVEKFSACANFHDVHVGLEVGGGGGGAFINNVMLYGTKFVHGVSNNYPIRAAGSIAVHTLPGTAIYTLNGVHMEGFERAVKLEGAGGQMFDD